MSASAPLSSPEYDPSSEALDAESPARRRFRQAVTVLTVPTIIIVFILAVQLSKDFELTGDELIDKFLQVGVALALGIFGVWALFWAMDRTINLLPRQWAARLRPIAYVGPALLALTFYLVYPAINTIVISLLDNKGEAFVGLDNYVTILTESQYQTGIRNSILWVLVVPAMSVAVGLVYAVMADRLSRRTETVAKSLIFLPMAISFVGASVVWGFMYFFRPPGFGEQIGLLNGILVALGLDPVNWLNQEPWNNAFLMFILVWLQTGFSMVILSSAIKGVPAELQEAARMDGANEWQTFRNITVPIISSTIVVVWTTVAITTWKVFDIVWVMTGGRNGTQVIAQQMVQEFFTFFRDGIGAALAVILFIAVIPILVVNIRRFQAQEEMR
jgi:alpha-glucoside transport system permease protein